MIDKSTVGKREEVYEKKRGSKKINKQIIPDIS